MRFGLAGVPEYLFSLFARVVRGEGVVAVKLRVKELLSYDSGMYICILIRKISPCHSKYACDFYCDG